MDFIGYITSGYIIALIVIVVIVIATPNDKLKR